MDAGKPTHAHTVKAKSNHTIHKINTHHSKCVEENFELFRVDGATTVRIKGVKRFLVDCNLSWWQPVKLRHLASKTVSYAVPSGAQGRMRLWSVVLTTLRTQSRTTAAQGGGVVRLRRLLPSHGCRCVVAVVAITVVFYDCG